MAARVGNVASATLVENMRTAIDEAIIPGPDFLGGTVDADTMANHMVATVTGFRDKHLPELQKAGDDGLLNRPEVAHLWQALGELYVCGSGYLADRCDADCVARTMTQMVHEFPLDESVSGT